MFEGFSNVFEKSFRIFFIIWVSIWSLVNASQSLILFASFNYQFDSFSDDRALLRWWLTTIGSLIGLTIGIILLFFMSSAATRIRDSKMIKGTGFWLAISVLYYLIPTALSLTAEVFFGDINRSTLNLLIFNSVWIFPSIVLLVLHIIYFTNLNTYNSQLALENKN
jgi:ABC-type uncharacterized transport system permease subunit